MYHIMSTNTEEKEEKKIRRKKPSLSLEMTDWKKERDCKLCRHQMMRKPTKICRFYLKVLALFMNAYGIHRDLYIVDDNSDVFFLVMRTTCCVLHTCCRVHNQQSCVPNTIEIISFTKQTYRWIQWEFTPKSSCCNVKQSPIWFIVGYKWLLLTVLFLGLAYMIIT